MSYIDELKQELKKHHVQQETIDDIVADHEDMIREAMAEGLNEDELNKKFGDPAKLASELAQTTPKEDSTKKATGEPWKKLMHNGSELKTDIKLVNEDILVRLDDEADIRVYLLDGTPRLEDYTCKIEADTLFFHAPKHLRTSIFAFHQKDPLFEIRIPKQMVLSLFKMQTVNGDATLEGVNATLIEAGTTNGDLSIEGGVFGKTKVNTVNGDVCIANATLDAFIGSAVSGDVSVKNSNIKGDLILNSVSGDAEVQDCDADYAELSTVSGDLNGVEFYPKRLALKSVSGDIEIKNRRTDNVEIVRKSTVSGSISIRSR